MVNCNPSRTPVDTESKLGPEGVSVQDPTLYRSLAGGYSILHLHGPVDFGLQFYISATTSLVGYKDADWAGYPSTRRSTSGTDNQEKDEKQSQNDKTGLGMEKTVKDKAKSKPESQSSQKVNRKVNWSKSKSTQVNPGAKVQEI
ncbi:ribonuclease H-like domain-containing protein [Tanacetum coccineum]